MRNIIIHDGINNSSCLLSVCETFGLIVNIEYGRTLLILQEGIEKLKASHKQIEAEKKKVESALVKERKAHGDKTLPTVLTAKHHLALSATLSGKTI